MESTQNDRLMHYLSLMRAADAGTVCGLITDATSDPHLFVFAELLAQPSVGALVGTPAEPHHRLLRLFAHGTISDYRAAAADLPALSAAQQAKLRLLTLLSLSDGRNRLPYGLLRERLALASDAAVEQLVVDAVYAGLLRARMDQRERAVEVSAAVGRDVVAPDGVRHMAATLSAWVQRSAALVAEIDTRMAFIADQTRLVEEQKAEASARVARAQHATRDSPGGDALGDGSAMDDVVVTSERFADRRSAQGNVPRRPNRSRIET